MIADFGLTRFRRSQPNDSSGVPFEFGVSTYRAPECGNKKKVGRAGDIWSLGCIFSEVVTFSFLGFGNGVEEFMKCRQAGSADGRDLFHDGENAKPEVLSWFQSLVDSHCDDFLYNFIELLKDMLYKDPERRPKIGVVEQRLDEMIQKERRKLGISIGITPIAKNSTENTGPPSFLITPTRRSWGELGVSLVDSFWRRFGGISLNPKTAEPSTCTLHDSDNTSLRRRSVSHDERIETSPSNTRPRSASDCGVIANPPDSNTPDRRRTPSPIPVDRNTSRQPMDVMGGGSYGSHRVVAHQVPNQLGSDPHRGHSTPSLLPPSLFTSAYTSPEMNPFETPTSRRPSLTGLIKSLHDLQKLLKMLNSFHTVLFFPSHSPLQYIHSIVSCDVVTRRLWSWLVLIGLTVDVPHR